MKKKAKKKFKCNHEKMIEKHGFCSIPWKTMTKKGCRCYARAPFSYHRAGSFVKPTPPISEKENKKIRAAYLKKIRERRKAVKDGTLVFTWRRSYNAPFEWIDPVKNPDAYIYDY